MAKKKQYRRVSCYKCGILDTQPNMTRRTITTTIQSRPKATKATWMGVLLDRPKSINAVGRSIFNDSGREYKRKKEVWFCKECNAKEEQVDSQIGCAWAVIIGLIGLSILIFL